MPDLHLRLRDSDRVTTAEARSTTPESVALDESNALELLRVSEITASKLIPWGSNYTFAVAIEPPDGGEHLAIYKPRAGETPLWDFPEGTLYLREHASYLLSRQLNWDIVPPTVVRDGPHGIGSLQLYVEPKSNRGDDYEFWGQRTLEIERLVVFDLITNNADRKLTHCLVDTRDRIWGIDHGLTFNVDPKLRTVLWQFTETGIAASILEDLQAMLTSKPKVYEVLARNLEADEIEVLFARIEALITLGKHPTLDPRSNVPYGWW